MSFEQNDNNTIHLGNYEEYFILYMDNELSDGQMKMVDAFLLAHPDLQSEFEGLMSTKLPAEEFSFDKTQLLADKMKLGCIDEDLLLYIDDELASDKKNIVELQLSSNKDYQFQHQSLLQTKLDPFEKILYPNKQELYRRTERLVVFKLWMRVAAAVIIIAVAGLLYFKNSGSINISGTNNQLPVANNTRQTSPLKKVQNTNQIEHINQQQTAITSTAAKKEEHLNKTNTPKQEEKKIKMDEDKPLIALSASHDDPSDVNRTFVPKLDFTSDNKTNTVASNDPKLSINKADVTSSVVDRTINEQPVEPKENSIADNDRKGSVKGFLRKATRMIEKRTGIDPANDNGELLIGAVAISLK